MATSLNERINADFFSHFTTPTMPWLDTDNDVAEVRLSRKADNVDAVRKVSVRVAGAAVERVMLGGAVRARRTGINLDMDDIVYGLLFASIRLALSCAFC